MPICIRSNFRLVEVQLLFIIKLSLVSKHRVVDRKLGLACMIVENGVCRGPRNIC